MTTPLSSAQQLIKSAKSVLFITGAGLSADSGLPTYRGVGGLYEGQRTDEGYAIETALSASMFRRHPEITWKYLWQIGSACYQAKFNQGHTIIADIEKNKPNTWVLTQNIDGFHHQAGSKNLIEIHGRAERLYCLDCDFQSTAEQLLANYQQTINLPPHCPQCGGLIRPDVVLFEEMLPEKALSQLYQLLDTMPFDVVVVVGTSAQFPYIQQPVVIAKQLGIPVIEINPIDSELSRLASYHLRGGAAEMLTTLWKMA
ncbi:MAG TPA: NAD-dependent deacylase [Agitococcus sp.]|nr:NAD-dependent deacylase [Agitococcus sp.]